MKDTTVYSATLIELNKNHTSQGNISAINNGIEIPFHIKRVYYLYDVPGGEQRGAHAHKDLHQLIIAASGSFDLVLNDGRTKRTFHLNRPYVGVYMPPGLWRELNNFSSGSICLVLASDTYTEGDYIRNYMEFLNYKTK